MIGKVVAHYRIIEKIGSGGMGEIYLAEDTKLERQVALKFLPRHLTEDREARTRFEREAKAAAALNHPNIITIHEIGEHEGQVFIAMEYIDGQTLKELIAVNRAPSTVSQSPSTPHPLPITQVLDIATQIAEGLSAAHEKGIIHRDIKPQNILVDKDGRVKILDFGLAKLKGASPLTQESFAMGTVHYMSPEQGLGREVDARTDIWSLGVVLYEMLAGRLPFLGDYDQAVIYAIVNEEMAPMPDAARKAFPGLENIIRRCLFKKSQDRYASAEALAAALRESGGSRAATKPERSTRRKLFRPAFQIAFSLLLLSGILGFFALNPKANAALKRVLGLAGIPRVKNLAVLPLLVIGGDSSSRAFSDGLVETLTSKLTQIEQTERSMWIVPASELRSSGIDSPGRARRALGVNLVVTGSLQQRDDSLRLILNLIDTDAMRQLRSAIITETGSIGADFQDRAASEVARMLDLELNPAILNRLAAGGTSRPGANELYLQGRGYLQRYEKQDSLDAAIGLFQRAVQEDAGFALAFAGLGEAYWRKYELTKAPELVREAQDSCQRAMKLSGNLVPVQITLGIIESGRGNYQEAIRSFQTALALDPVNSEALLELAIAYEKAGHMAEAEATYRHAIDLKPNYWAAVNSLGFFYYFNGRLPEAAAMFRKVTELTPDNVRGFNNLGSVYQFQGKNALARQMFEKSLAIQANADAYSNLGTIHFFERHFREAAAMYEKGIALGMNDCQIWGNLGDAYYNLPGLGEKARTAYQTAIRLANEQLRINSRDAHLRSSLGLYYAKAGQAAPALSETEKAREMAENDVIVLFNAALVYELAGERGPALSALKTYFALSGPRQYVDQDPLFAELRSDPDYAALLADKQDSRNQGP
jgi:serine/threonine protein kinase/Flp pilus assembly protein TadD